MCDKSIEENLKLAFANVNDWLKFAEQKNGALLVLNAGLIWGLTRILTKFGELPDLSWWPALLGYVLVVGSGLVCLISFFPVLKEKWFKPEEKSSADNCLFFQHIAKYTKFEYAELLAQKLGLTNYSPTRYELDLSSQVVTNAEIALDKYKKFKLASSLTVIAVLLFSLSIGVHYFQ